MPERGFFVGTADGVTGNRQTEGRILTVMKILNQGVTAPLGFKAAGVEAGIKKEGRKDMAMLYSEADCVLAGTFTSNLVKAAPVLWDMQAVKSGVPARACVINSGIANACTGSEGFAYCAQEAQECARQLGIRPEQVLTASTGVIGAQLPMDKILFGIGELAKALSPDEAGGSDAASAIMTTDTKKKEIAVSFSLQGHDVTIGGMCKGSGMIHPNMCTMLSFITTDAAISAQALQKALSDSVKDSYNMISVDGDTSTNDTCLVFANGMAGNSPITEDGEDYAAFCEALDYVNIYLAKQMAADGEGAMALFEVVVEGAETKEQAVTLSKSVITSNLVKTAIAGHDANWGRIICAMGYSGASFDPDRVDLFFESRAGMIKIIENGTAAGYSEEEATKILSEDEIRARIDLKMGDCKATAWGCDLTHEYISINADYRS